MLTGVAGVVAAHVVDYCAVFPDGAERARHLAVTGHGYWPVAATAALLSAVTVMGTALRLGMTRLRRPAGPAPPPGWWLRLSHLARVQVVLFAAVEVVERIAAGSHPARLFESPEFALGVVLQVVIAAVALLVLSGTERVGQAVARRRRPARRRTYQRPHPVAAGAVRLDVRRTGSRAPPPRFA